MSGFSFNNPGFTGTLVRSDYSAEWQALKTNLEAQGIFLTTAKHNAADRRIRDWKGEFNSAYTTGVDFWTNLKAFWGLVGGTSGSNALNWKSPGTFDLSHVGSPTHSTDGITFNAVNQRCTTGLIPSTHLQQNTVTIGCYSRTNVDGTQVLMGASGAAGNNGLYILPRSTNTNYSRANDNGVGAAGGANTDSSGTMNLTRTAANARAFYRKTATIISDSTASVALTSQELYLGALNQNGTATNFCAHNLAGAWVIDRGITAAEPLIIHNIETAFNTAWGRP